MANSKRHSAKKLWIVLIVLVVIMFMLAIGFAWYSRFIKHTDTEELGIMTPYALYLLNSGATDTLELNVGGIHPGETKQIVVCVSSHDVDAKEEETSKEGEFPYKLELVHTDNIGLSYHLYPLTPVEDVSEPIDEDIVVSDYIVSDGETEVVQTAYFTKGSLLTGDESLTQEYQDEMYQGLDKTAIVNQGTYCVYSEDDFELSLKDPGKRYNYFLIELQWDANETEKKSKETDLVYLVAKAGVPKPVEIQK